MSTREPIVIAGGGIGGLCLAAALTRRKIRWVLLERARALEPKGTGIALMPPALRVLDKLGLLPEALAASHPIPGTRRYRGDGKLLFDIPYDSVWGGQQSRAIHRTDLQAVLLSAATGGEVMLGKRVEGATAANAAVTINLDSGQMTCSLLVGADGVRSAVRTSLGGAQPRLLGQKVYRAHTSATGLADRHVVFFGRKAVLGFVSLRTGTYLFVNEFNCDSEDPGPVAGRRQRVIDLLSDISAPEAAASFALWPSDTEIHEDATWEAPVVDMGWRFGRTILLGDAAHAMAPVLAVGAAMAMEDAWVLAEELDTHSNIDNALDAYVVRRTERVKWVQSASGAIVRRAQTGQRVLDLEGELKSAYEPLLAEP